MNRSLRRNPNGEAPDLASAPKDAAVASLVGGVVGIALGAAAGAAMAYGIDALYGKSPDLQRGMVAGAVLGAYLGTSIGADKGADPHGPAVAHGAKVGAGIGSLSLVLAKSAVRWMMERREVEPPSAQLVIDAVAVLAGGAGGAYIGARHASKKLEGEA